MGLSKPSWCILKTKRWYEEKVAVILESRGIEIFLPSLDRARPTRAGQWGTPLLPSYLFVRLAIPSDEYVRVRSAPGVAGLVSFGNSPAVVPDSVIGIIKARVQMENIVHSGDPLKQGERPVVAERLLRDAEAVFDTRLTADDRVRVLIDLSSAHSGELAGTR